MGADRSGREIGQLRWRCRRGMRELDRLLIAYLNDHYAAASAAEQRAFSELLDLPDPQLWQYCSGREQPSSGTQRALISALTRVSTD